MSAADREPHARRLHRSRCVRIDAWSCSGRDAATATDEAASAHTIVLVRRGAFVKRVRGRELVADAGSALYFERDEPYRVRHPMGGDACTSFTLDEEVLFEVLAASDPSSVDRRASPFRDAHAPCSARSHLLHHKLYQRLVSVAADDCFADEIALALCAELVRPLARPKSRRARRVRARTHADHRDRVEAAKVALQRRLHGRVSLDEIAESVHSSPFHFARMFRKYAGTPVHRYLGTLRLRAALAAIVDGERDLTALALGLGYFDHSHFTNAFRREFGITPSRARATMTDSELRELSKNLQA